MKDLELYSVQKPQKSTKCETQIIGFSDDYTGVSLPYTDALVLSLVVANHRIHGVLIDTGCSANILYKRTFELKKIDHRKIVPARHSLRGFSGEQVFQFGSIELSVMAGTYPRKKTIMVKFMVINQPSGFNANLERTLLNELKAITLTPHVSMKFATEEGIGVQKGDQRMAQEC
jgi:hypothetical protein